MRRCCSLDSGRAEVGGWRGGSGVSWFSWRLVNAVVIDRAGLLQWVGKLTSRADERRVVAALDRALAAAHSAAPPAPASLVFDHVTVIPLTSALSRNP